MTHGRWRWRAALCLAAATLPGAARARSQARATEADVKAAYLFNFAQFVRWPPAALPPGAPFTFCVLGTDPFGPALDKAIENETIDGHQAVARRVSQAAEASACHILFIGETDDARIASALGALDHKPTLTVSDAPKFVRAGGMIQFVRVDSRVRFALNLDATSAAELETSSELARVAQSVQHRGGGG